jgi:hypothetical protein
MSFKELSQDMSLSYSQVVSLEMMLAANEYQIHSDFEMSASLKYSENCFCEAFFLSFCFIAGQPSKVGNLSEMLHYMFLPYNSFSWMH